MPKQSILTNTAIKHAKPKVKEYNLAAGKGLYLRITPSGTKSWLFNYFKPHLDTRSNIGLGTYPELSLEKALRKRDEFRALVADGQDPKTVRGSLSHQTKVRLNNTFEYVFRGWLEVKRPEVSERYLNRIQNVFELHVLPGIGNAPISTLTAPYVIDNIRHLEVSRSLESLRKVCRWLNEIMVYALNTGIIVANPLFGIRKAFHAPKSTNRPTIKPSELPLLMQDLKEARMTLQTRCVLEWLLHTLVRPKEGASVEWSELDLQKALWTIPASKMKMKRDHIVPLTPQAIQIIEVMRPISGHRPYVFPSNLRPLDHMHPETANTALNRMGYKNRLVAHGLRSLGSTVLNEHGFEAELIEVSLAHVDSTVRGDYNRSAYIERRREIMNWWSQHIEEAITKPGP